MKIETYKIQTASGSLYTYFGNPLNFLNETELKAFNEIGYTGKLNGVKTTWTEYLDSLGKGTFAITQIKYDNGDFSAEYIISRATI